MLAAIRDAGLFNSRSSRAALALLWCGNAAFLAAMFGAGAQAGTVCTAGSWLGSAGLTASAAYLLLQVSLIAVFLGALRHILSSSAHPMAA